MRHIFRIQERQSASRTFPLPSLAVVLALAAMGWMLLAPRTASGQASAGITGTVTDSTGAVIKGAHVTITNEGTSVSDHTVTESAGTYSFKGVLPGKYTVAVDAQGFKKEVQKGVTVAVSTNSNIDFTLNAGAANETVQVAADQIALNTTQPELGSTIDPIVVEALPEEVSGRGRQVDQLQFLAPGTTGSTFSHRISGGVDFEQEILYNGIPAPQPETEGYTTNFNPPFDLVEESRVERSTFSAQFGLGQGALSYQMKSGTNSYHGSGFEINRNSFFDSKGFFNSSVPVDRENNYGFSIGGPIRIPHLYDGRNKTFGNYSQEWYKQNNENTSVSTVPTKLEKTGDFSDYVDSNGAIIPIYDPNTGLQFMGCNGTTPNVICGNRISTNSAALIPDIPDPDRTGSGPGGLLSNKSFAPYVSPNIQHVWGFVVDQTLTPTQSLHYAEWRNSYTTHSFDYNPMVLAPNPLNSQKYEPALGSVFLLNYTNAITPHLVVTAGLGWIGEINNQYNITKGYTTPTVTNENIPPNITFGPSSSQCNSNTYTCWGTSGSWFQSINRKLGIAIENNWLWTKGRNTFNFGIDIRRAYQDDNEEQTEGGHFNFSPAQTSTPSSTDPNFGNYGNAFASFLLGLPDSANRSNSQELELRNRAISPYIQDDIKLSPKLTLNVGLRWDIQVPFTENHNLIVFFNQDKPGTDPAASGIAGSATQFGSCTGCAGYTRADIHWGHFGPRLGFAYKLNNKTVVQGGLDVAFLDGGAYEYGTNKVAVNYGNLLTGSFTRNSTGGNTSSLGSWDTNSIPAVIPTPFSPGLGAGNQIEAFSRNDGYAPYSQQWNLNVQRELPYSMFITAAFVGNRIIHLPSQNNRIDQMNPSYDAQYGNMLSTCAANAGNSVLTDTFTNAGGSNGCAAADGFASPYANFVNDFGGSSTVAQSLVPYPQYSYIFNNFEGFGTTYYQSAQIEVEKRFTNGLYFLAGYTLSRLMDNTSSGFSSFTSGGINKYNQKPEWAISNADEPQTLKASGTYELPIGPGKKFVNNQVLGNVVGGWQVGWILDYEAGSANGPGENGSPFPNGFDRPDRNSSVALSTTSYKKARDYFTKKIAVAQMFNPGAFTVTANQYTFGNAQRNYTGMRNAPLYMESLNARKKFYIGEHLTGILQVDYFNAFNRTQFNGPDNNASDSAFGQVTNQGSNISNRQGQVQFRLQF
ncbi:MAG: carboxypeptidase-like regulatory domain-containing protein [Terracidiphilus sp.]|nr:carboxypeptidase-like regulatory domain-containing protein [Terracidiphilus sp.]